MAQEVSSSKQLSRTELIVSWFLPNLGDVIFILVLVFLLRLLPNFVFFDGSTGWHIVTGQYVLQHWVPGRDVISYTFANSPWVAYEWLSDSLMALLERLGNGDLNLLAVAVSSAIAALMLLLYDRCRKEGANFLLALVIVLIGAIISAIHWLARPHIFCFYGVYFFSIWLEDFWQSKLSVKQFLSRIMLFMILWVNTHPAFLIGFALIAIYLSSSLLLWIINLRTTNAAEHRRKAQVLISAVVLCVVATFINPYGVGLHEYLLHYMKANAAVANATNEFFSPVFHGALQPSCLEILFALFIIGLSISRNRLSLPRLLTCLAFTHLTLSAVRSMPLYVIVILPAVSQLFAEVSIGGNHVQNAERQPWWKPLCLKWQRMNVIFTENERLCSKHALSVVIFLFLSIVALNHGQFFGSRLLNSGWSEDDKPTRTIDYLQKAESNGQLDPDRGFNYDNWGGYLRYKLGKRVLIDDRGEFYSPDFYTKYTVVIFDQAGRKDMLDGKIYDGTAKAGSSVQWVLIPKNLPLALALRNDPQWGPPVVEDGASVLFVRRSKQN